MNKFLKILYAVLAGIDVIFNLFAPMAVAILWIIQFGSNNFGSKVILIVAMVSTIYKAIEFFTIREKY